MDIHAQNSNDLELAWLAGFIDGDGHISIVLNGKKFAPIISMFNTDYPTQKIILDILNKNNFHKFKPTNREPKKPNYNNYWKIATQGFEQCLVWVNLLTPYLKTKL